MFSVFLFSLAYLLTKPFRVCGHKLEMERYSLNRALLSSSFRVFVMVSELNLALRLHKMIQLYCTSIRLEDLCNSQVCPLYLSLQPVRLA